MNTKYALEYYTFIANNRFNLDLRKITSDIWKNVVLRITNFVHKLEYKPGLKIFTLRFSRSIPFCRLFQNTHLFSSGTCSNYTSSVRRFSKNKFPITCTNNYWKTNIIPERNLNERCKDSRIVNNFSFTKHNIIVEYANLPLK